MKELNEVLKEMRSINLLVVLISQAFQLQIVLI